MKKARKTIIICVFIFAAMFLFSFSPVSAQYSTKGMTYPWYFGTTSVMNYGAFPYVMDYASKFQPYFGTTFVGSGPAIGDVGYLSSVRLHPDAAVMYVADPYIVNLMQALQYYQYLSYAYQFYQIARTTPMFYLQDIVADYIGSSLYSYANQYNLSPEAAIISFIQQNLL